MGAITLGEILSLAEHMTVAGLLLLAVIGSIKQLWVPFWLYRQVIVERDEYRHELFETLGLADRTSRALDRTTDSVLSLATVRQQPTGRRASRLNRLEAQRNVRRIDETDTDDLDSDG